MPDQDAEALFGSIQLFSDPPECILTNSLVDVMPLSASPDTWAGKIIGMWNTPRTDCHAEIAAHGFDITTEAVKLQEFYLEVTNEFPT